MLVRTIFLITALIGAHFSLSAQTYTSSDKKAIKAFEEASKLFEMREFEQAILRTSNALERDPQFAEAWLIQADVFIELGRINEAIASLEQAVDVNPDFFPNKYFTLGMLYMDQSRYNVAAGQFRRLLKYREVSPPIKERAQRQLKNCEFAEEAIKNPVPFDPQNIGEGVNTWMAEYYPSITVDGRQLLFTREVKNSPEQRRGQEDFFISTWDGENWGPAAPMTDINTPGNEGAPAISPDGQTMVFTACDLYGSYGPDRVGYGSCDLFITYRVGNGWAKAKNMGDRINSPHWESQPSISADGRTLYFVRGNRNPGKRNSNIYMSQLDEKGNWGIPEKLSATINTDGNEESVLIHPDGKTLYFSSDGHPGIGGLDIFVSRRIGHNEWTTPQNLGYPINTPADENSLLVSPSGEVAFFSSDRAGGFGDLDLYSFTLPESVRPDPVSYVRGTVFDEETRRPLFAQFELIDLETGEVVVQSYSNSDDGGFLVALPLNRRYALNASKKGYLFYSDHFDLLDASKYRDGKSIDVPLSKVREGVTMVLNNIFFDTDRFDLKPESKVELEKLISFLELNEGLNAEISGHTDNQGSAQHNKTLSENRAKAVRDYLVAEGIDAARLRSKGYGQDKPIADNNTEEGRAQNRRTELTIIE